MSVIKHRVPSQLPRISPTLRSSLVVFRTDHITVVYMIDSNKIKIDQQIDDCTLLDDPYP